MLRTGFEPLSMASIGSRSRRLDLELCVTVCVSLSWSRYVCSRSRYVCHGLCVMVTVCVTVCVLTVTVCVSRSVCHGLCVTVCVSWSRYACHVLCVMVAICGQCHGLCTRSRSVCHSVCHGHCLCVTVTVCADGHGPCAALRGDVRAEVRPLGAEQPGQHLGPRPGRRLEARAARAGRLLRPRLQHPGSRAPAA